MSIKQKHKIRKDHLIYLYILKTILKNKRKNGLDFYTTDIFFSYSEFERCVARDKKNMLDNFNMLIDKIDFTRSVSNTDYYRCFIYKESAIPGLYYIRGYEFDFDDQEIVSIIFGKDITTDDIRIIQNNYERQRIKLFEDIHNVYFRREDMVLFSRLNESLIFTLNEVA